MRDEALAVLYESVKDRLSMSRDEFCAALADWNVYPLTHDGELTGALIEKGGEVHIGFDSKPSGSIIRHIRGVFTDVLKKRGALSTKVVEANHKGLRFCKRLGFEEVKREKGIVFMRCERFNYA